MSKIIAINAIEVNSDYPAKGALIKESADKVLAWIRYYPGDRYIGVISSGSDLKGPLEQLGLETREIDGTQGLLCQEPSAVIHGLNEEKPLPSNRAALLSGDEIQVINLLDLVPGKSLLELFCRPDPNQCIVQNMLALIHKLSDQCCGKCVFCREGLGQMALILKDIDLGGGSADDIHSLLELADLLHTQVTCGFGPAAAGAITAILNGERADLSDHVEKKHCNKAICTGLSFYKILGSKCIGCGDCIDQCPEDAIAGKPKFIHVINERDCTRCGACASICSTHAIIRCSTLNKPICPPRPVPVNAWKK